MRKVLRWLVEALYGFRAWNEEALKTPGPVLLLPNHVSWWDWLLIGICLAEDWRFVTSSTSAEISWLHKRVMVNRRTFPVDMSSPFALKRMAEYLRGGGRLVLFPEGRLTRTGSLMKLYEGTGFLLHKTGARVITAYLRRAERLPWSPNPNRKQLLPRLSAHFSPALTLPFDEHLRPAVTRSRLMDKLRAQMVRQQFETEMEFGHATIPEALADAARRHAGRIILEDATQQQLTYRRVTMGAGLLAQAFRKCLLLDQPRVGVLLPNANALPVTLLGLWLADRIPAILNYSVGSVQQVACVRLAGLKQVITSHRFVERGRLDLAPLAAAGVAFIYLEDIRAGISPINKALAQLKGLVSTSGLRSRAKPQDTAVILFTSGSEGAPKGVELTHRNLLANIRQMLSLIDLVETDRFFNALPLFHSFGLTVGLLLPMLRGVYTFLYLSPLHYRVVPAAVYNWDCTVLLGTNTFLAGYGRKAHAYDFRSLRYVFAAGEKLQDTTASMWMQRFGMRLLEGYGATECSPCLTVNVPLGAKPGSVGQFLPGIEYRFEQIPGVAANHGSAGRLFVRGPNVMKGYLNPEADADFKSLGGWYDTGDIARLEEDGYLYIEGRLKRFAKISGEMVSLTAVEDALAGAFPQFGLRFAIAVIAVPDEVKGERLVAVSNEPRLTIEEVRSAIRTRGLGNLAAPRDVHTVRDLPKLGTGKINHRELEKMIFPS